jgi:hypothetical protein
MEVFQVPAKACCLFTASSCSREDVSPGFLYVTGAPDIVLGLEDDVGARRSA